MSVSKTDSRLLYQQPIVIGFNSIMGWYTDKPGNGSQSSNSADNSTPVVSPPTRRAIQIKERTNSDISSDPPSAINDDDVTTRNTGGQLLVDREMTLSAMREIISKAVCERAHHYLLMKRMRQEVSCINLRNFRS